MNTEKLITTVYSAAKCYIEYRCSQRQVVINASLMLPADPLESCFLCLDQQHQAKAEICTTCLTLKRKRRKRGCSSVSHSHAILEPAVESATTQNTRRPCLWGWRPSLPLQGQQTPPDHCYTLEDKVRVCPICSLSLWPSQGQLLLLFEMDR